MSRVENLPFKEQIQLPLAALLLSESSLSLYCNLLHFSQSSRANLIVLQSIDCGEKLKIASNAAAKVTSEAAKQHGLCTQKAQGLFSQNLI